MEPITEVLIIASIAIVVGVALVILTKKKVDQVTIEDM